MPGIDWIDMVVIGAYLVLIVAMGMVFARFNRNDSDYFRGGSQGTWWLVGSSAFMSGFSAYTFTAASGVAFEAGWSVMIIYMANAIGYLLISNTMGLAAVAFGFFICYKYLR